MSPTAERHQFALLARDSVRQVLASATVAQAADPIRFALWGAALALTPPLLVAVRKVIDYPFLLRAPAAYVERVVLGDRLFFILYSMLISAFLAALVWEALSPARQDHEVLGPLPVAPRTVAAARLVAAFGVCLALAFAVNVPSGVLYSAASAVHPLVGSFPRVLVGHLLSTILAALWVFATLLTLRTAITVCAGARLAARFAVALQIGTFALLVLVFLFLPGILPELVAKPHVHAQSYEPFVPVWFAALFAWVAEGQGVAQILPLWAVVATGSAVVVASGLALVTAAPLRRRDLERRADGAAGWGLRVLTTVAWACLRRPDVRAVYVFAMASLSRSRQHAVQLGTYAGLALAAALLYLVASFLRGTLDLTSPQGPVAAVPLVAIFFAVMGLRTACARPVEPDANWPFRLSPLSAAQAVAATRVVLLTAGILPIAGVTMVVSAWLWGVADAVWLTGWDLAVGYLLAELVLVQWRKVPFATAHEPSVETMRTRWPWYVVALYLYSGPGAVLQVWSLSSPDRALAFTATGLVSGIAATMWGVHARRTACATLDVESEGPAVLSLSPALD